MELLHPTKARPGDRIAVLSPSLAAPGFAPAVHEQAMARLAQATGLIPVEYPTTRRLGASAVERARDLNEAFADPSVRAILATIGGEDQITVIRHLDVQAVRRDPKPFLGYSDNTNLHQWLWGNGVASFYGGSSQVHLGPGPQVDPIHLASLRAALLTGETLEITEPGESEDYGVDWLDPRALSENGQREATDPWAWAGPRSAVTGPTWGGCLEVLQAILVAGRFPADPRVLDDAVMLLETSELLPSASEVRLMLRAMGERGLLEAVGAVVVARPPASSLEDRPDARTRARHRAEQREAVIETIGAYNPGAVVCVGVPFGHTRPQWILPHGGTMTIDGVARRISADYS